MIIYEALYPARKKWVDICMKLGADCEDLDVIDEDNKNDSQKCLRKTLVHLFQTKPPTRRDVIKALQSSIVNHRALAGRLKKKWKL